MIDLGYSIAKHGKFKKINFGENLLDAIIEWALIIWMTL